MKSIVCEICALYATKYEEVFKMLQTFVETVWTLLTTTGLESKYDIVSKNYFFRATYYIGLIILTFLILTILLFNYNSLSVRPWLFCLKSSSWNVIAVFSRNTKFSLNFAKKLFYRTCILDVSYTVTLTRIGGIML